MEVKSNIPEGSRVGGSHWADPAGGFVYFECSMICQEEAEGGEGWRKCFDLDGQGASGMLS
jgi:hypothetical protein